ncbi:MAG: hypothetical protein CAF44_003330 [Nitrospira sp. CG24D]|jgi:hypothetical protein|nr:MAG: hypothetical protein CAF44_003330 [Nitrospira sp. CG24D]
MEQSASSSNPLPPQRTNLRATIIVLVFVGAFIALGLAKVMRDTPAACPDELIGTWNTAAQGYEDSMLVMTTHAVIFSAGRDHLDAQAVRRLEASPDGSRVLYTLVYGNSRNEEQTLIFFYDSHDQTITFKNQSHLIWTRAMVES